MDVHLDLKNVYSARIMHKATGGSHVFMAGNRWKMMLIQVGKLPLGQIKMREKLVSLSHRIG